MRYSRERPARPADGLADPYREDQQDALDDVLRKRLHAEEVQSVAQDPENEHGHYCAHDSPLAARERGPAEDDGHDDVELEADARIRIARRHPRVDEDAGDPRGQAREDVEDDSGRVDRDARQPGRLGVAAAGDGPSAEQRFALDEQHGRRHHRKDEDGRGDGTDRARGEVVECQGDALPRLAAGQQERHAAPHVEGAEGGYDRVDPQPDHENGVDGTKDPPARIPIPKASSRGQPASAANLAATTPAIATTDPTDRSSPPPTITSVTAQLVMPTNETWRSTLDRFSTVKNRSVVSEKTTPTRMRIPMLRANVWFVGRAIHVRREPRKAAIGSFPVAGVAASFSLLLLGLLMPANRGRCG